MDSVHVDRQHSTQRPLTNDRPGPSATPHQTPVGSLVCSAPRPRPGRRDRPRAPASGHGCFPKAESQEEPSPLTLVSGSVTPADRQAAGEDPGVPPAPKRTGENPASATGVKRVAELLGRPRLIFKGRKTRR